MSEIDLGLSMMEYDDSLVSLRIKIDLLKASIKKVQRYELLTTNQYIQQMELVIEILKDISQNYSSGI